MIGLVASWIVAASPACAQLTALTSAAQFSDGVVAHLPSDSVYSRQSGLQLEFDSRWTNNFGYRPIRIGVATDQPSTAERRIKIRLCAGSWDWRAGTVQVEQQFDLPQGATLAETIVSCPQYHEGHRYWWTVWVDGVVDADLSVAESAAGQLTAAGNVAPSNTSRKFLMVGPSGTSQRMISSGSDVFDASVLSIDELPSRWIDYSAVDAIAIAPEQLHQLADARPDVLAALRLWNRAGGQFWINPVGERWEQLAEVERLLQLSRVGDAGSKEREVEVPLGWHAVSLDGASQLRRVAFQHILSGRVQELTDPATIAALRLDANYLVVRETGTEPPNSSVATRDADPAKNTPRDSTQWYIQRPNGLGFVRAIRQVWDPVGFGISWRLLIGSSPYDAPPLPTPLAVALETTRTWESRHGMTPNSANSDFANLLVPGVGLAPVTEFRWLITLFVLAIGPFNYWLLRRADRLDLIILTVPLVALALTAGLLGYAMFLEGLSTTARVRSYTTLDQRTGDAACWARLSYYSNLAPQSGMEFSDDVALYPIIPGWNEASSGVFLGMNRSLAWTDGRQRLRGDWLLSRVPMQYLAVRARKSPHRLDLRSAAGRLTATNRLGTRILFVVAVDEQGQAFVGDAIDAGASVALEEATQDDALRKLRKLISDSEPVTPAALADDRSDFSRLQRRQTRRLFRTQLGLEYGAERLSTNRQSEAIAGLAGTLDAPVLELPRRTYVAVTEKGPEVELGLSDVEEDGSFHLLEANW